jgi:hypothetical protein
MITLKPRHGLLAGLALILLSNAVALAGVWYNRQGEPESRLLLSERELRRSWDGPHKENSGLMLRLDWRMVRHNWSGEDSCRSEHGLTEAQMEAVGLPVNDSRSQRDAQQAWAVFELNGPAYRQSLRQAEVQLQEAINKLQQLPEHKRLKQEEKSARRALEDERFTESRLFLIDVGLDADALRQRYPDRSQYALLRGTVKVWSSCRRSDQKRYQAGTVHLHNESINVPVTWRQQLADLLPEYYGNAITPFTAEISIGQRFEPWLSAVQVTENRNRDDENGAPR